MGHLPPEPERRKTEVITEPKKYPCVFGLTDDCPVKKEFKLKPENLKPWCKICPVRHQEIKEIEAEVEAEEVQTCHKPTKQSG